MSCGCVKREKVIQRSFKHGMSKRGCVTPEYSTWKNMHTRCYDEKGKNYHNYGGRGIRVCDRWHRDNINGFINFYNDMGPRPLSKSSIDRYPDNDGNYEPGNCRWATQKEQMSNIRVFDGVGYKGDIITRTYLANEINLSSSVVGKYLRSGKTVDYIVEHADEISFKEILYTHCGVTKNEFQWGRRFRY